MIELTPESVLRALEEVVAETGEAFTYTKTPFLPSGRERLNVPRGVGALTEMVPAGACMYVHTPVMRGVDDSEGNEVGCLVARVLVKLGVPLDTIASLESGGGAMPAGDLLYLLSRAGTISGATETVRYLLVTAQNAQDTGLPYGEIFRLVQHRVGINRIDR